MPGGADKGPALIDVNDVPGMLGICGIGGMLGRVGMLGIETLEAPLFIMPVVAAGPVACTPGAVSDEPVGANGCDGAGGLLTLQGGAGLFPVADCGGATSFGGIRATSAGGVLTPFGVTEGFEVVTNAESGAGGMPASGSLTMCKLTMTCKPSLISASTRLLRFDIGPAISSPGARS